MTDRLITVKEAASRLSVSVRTVQRLINAGKLPCLKVGPKTRRISEADLDSFIQKMKQDAGTLEGQTAIPFNTGGA
jgi:excisionase family DNA binding protein